MYFTSGSNRAFESLMQGKPGFDHYDSGDAGAPEDCGDCRFYRPDWKYQFCVYAECPYQPGKLTAYDAVLFQVKGVDDEMAVFRVEKNRGYTVTLRHLDLLIAAESDTDFVLYDDDGHTEQCRQGVYSRTTISVKAGERTTISFRKEGSYADTVESLTLRLVSKKKGAYWVTVDGRPVPRTIVREVFDQSPCAWYYNMSDRTVWVKYPKPAKDDYDVVISTEKFDLVGMVKAEE